MSSFREYVQRIIKNTKIGSSILDYKRYSEYKNLIFFESSIVEKEAMSLLVQYHGMEKAKFLGYC